MDAQKKASHVYCTAAAASSHSLLKTISSLGFEGWQSVYYRLSEVQYGCLHSLRPEARPAFSDHQVAIDYGPTSTSVTFFIILFVLFAPAAESISHSTAGSPSESLLRAMLSILSGRRDHTTTAAAASRRNGEHSLHRICAALDPAPSPLDARCPRPPQRRRRHRSRNCRNSRQYGTYFQFTDAMTRLGRGHALGGSVDRQQARLRRQMEETRRRVQQLLEQHDLVEPRRINTRNYAVSYATNTAHRFFELFARGFDPVNHPIQSRQAEAFLRGVMRDDALCTEFRGVDMFLKQYQVGTEVHGSMALSLHRLVLLNRGDDSIQIKTEATASFRISRTTLERLFPSIIQDEPLAQQLIGREYKMQYDKVFHFADGRIYQNESRIDLCSGLLQLVGDPFLALKLFEASVLTKHGHWRMEEVAEDAHELPSTLL